MVRNEDKKWRDWTIFTCLAEADLKVNICAKEGMM